MSSRSNVKAYGLGAGVVGTIPCAAAAFLLGADFSWLLSLIFYGSVFLSGVVTAWMARARKIVLAVLLGVPFAASMALANTIHYLLGFPTDTPGMYGAGLVAVIFLFVGFAVCGLGGLMGWWMSRLKHNNAMQATCEDARA